MPAENLQAVLTALDNDLRDSIDLIELDDPVMQCAVIVARKHTLRGADAIQLAFMIFAQSDVPHGHLILLSADDELNAAAVSEGLQVENPNLHS